MLATFIRHHGPKSMLACSTSAHLSANALAEVAVSQRNAGEKRVKQYAEDEHLVSSEPSVLDVRVSDVHRC